MYVTSHFYRFLNFNHYSKKIQELLIIILQVLTPKNNSSENLSGVFEDVYWRSPRGVGLCEAGLSWPRVWLHRATLLRWNDSGLDWAENKLRLFFMVLWAWWWIPRLHCWLTWKREILLREILSLVKVAAKATQRLHLPGPEGPPAWAIILARPQMCNCAFWLWDWAPGFGLGGCGAAERCPGNYDQPFATGTAATMMAEDGPGVHCQRAMHQ